MDISRIDWNEVWNERREGNLSQYPKTVSDSWATRESAHDYLKIVRDRYDGWIKEILHDLPFTAESRVLDIGAGPGTLAIPLSSRVTHITVVEPADGMMEVLGERIAEENITNITCVKKRWEDVDIAHEIDCPFDIVIVAYSLGMPDIRTAIRKMCAASENRVYLFLTVGKNSLEEEMIHLWPRLHAREYRTQPSADILYNLLYDMGIYPNVRIMQKLDHKDRYPGINEVIEKFRNLFMVSTLEQETILREYLQSTLEQENGTFLHKRTSIPVMFWWDVSEIDGNQYEIKKTSISNSTK